ncbi:YgaP family membrane protein [Kaistella sp.]|uniref:YgaP family membrane protein n=1 Tax=Kaistella sp. TaxID=2782235 RepID=UPI002F93F8BE
MKTRTIHAVAGTMISASLLLGIFVQQNWFFLTGFVGINLFQSAFTNWCLLGNILEKFGIKDSAGDSCCS